MIPPRRSCSAGFELQPLESRLFLSAVAAATADEVASSAALEQGATPQATAPSELLTKAVRQNLLNHWTGPNKQSLQDKLNVSRLGAFDAALLEYLRERPGQTYYWKQSDVGDIVSFIKDELSTGFLIGHADDIVAHRFPEQGNSDFYEIQLPAGTINWDRQPPSTTNPEFVQGLNRHEYWMELAQAYRFTGNAKYVNEMIAQLTSWSEQNPALADPSTWSPESRRWNLLDTAIRAQTWANVHQIVLNASGWTPAANTLMLVKLWEHGDYLRRITGYDLASNRALIHGTGLLQIAQLFHEFSDAPSWETHARKIIFGAMDEQFYHDGGHVEQSPNYAVNGINHLLDAYLLDQRKGDAAKWPADRVRRLRNAMESHIQLLSPNGAMAALSDTYRNTSAQMLTKARIILGTTAWPPALPRMRDIWLFGPDAMEPLIELDVSPPLGDRGDSFGMSETGYYVMRSGTSSNSRQLTFDAGPKGGFHGHYDLLNIELFGYGKPLIADPGVYKYDDSDNRKYVISTPAHNTLSIDGQNQRALEGPDNPEIVVDQWTNGPEFAQVAAHHSAYSHLEGSPIVGRNVWYDYDDVALIVDWAEASASHEYTVSYNLPGDANTVSGVLADGSINTKHSSGNVKIAPLLRAGQTSARGPLRFISNNPPPDEMDPAYRFTVTGSGTFQVFATLVTTYSGRTPPNVTAQWVTTNPQPGQPVVLRLTKDGVSQDITFASPTQRPSQYLSSRTGSTNDTLFDASGRLHLAYYDRLTRNLKYTVRDTGGVWSTVQTIDPTLGAGEYLSLALDPQGRPAVAYFDGIAGDLKYASIGETGAWNARHVDWTGQVGLYPSLTFGRAGEPIIAYYDRTRGDLRLASGVRDTFRIATVDSGGDVGRWTSIALDPNYPRSTDVVIAYSDTSSGAYKYAAAFRGGWKTITIDDPSGNASGGYVSLAFQPTRTNGVFQPAVSYYDASETSVKFATFDGAHWALRTIATDGNVGLYSNLVYDGANRPNVFYYSKSNNRAYRATLNGGGNWAIAPLGVGGREMNVARHASGTLAYTTLDERGPLLELGLLHA